MPWIGPQLQTFNTAADPAEDAAVAAAIAAQAQRLIATAFERMMAPLGPLRDNTTAYTQSKIAQGFDIRRGHRTGELQRALYEVPLWSVTPSVEGATVRWSDAPLIAAVPHAVYYLAEKVPGGSLASVTIGLWVAAEEAATGGDSEAVAETLDAIGDQSDTARQSRRIRQDAAILGRSPTTAREQIIQQAVVTSSLARRRAATTQLEAAALSRAGVRGERVAVAGTQLNVVNPRREAVRRASVRGPNAAR